MEAQKLHEKLITEMPYKWRVQSFSKKTATATCVAYIDSRQVQERLDEAVGCDRWQDAYKEVKGNVYAGIGILINGEWVWKWDCGVESNMDAEKGEASDSFKRAAVKWGIGRFLYSLPIQTVKSNEVKSKDNYPYVVDDKGKRVWDLTAHIKKTPQKQDSEDLFNRSEMEALYKSILYSEEFTLEEKVKMELKSAWDDEKLASGIKHLSKEKTKRSKQVKAA